MKTSLALVASMGLLGLASCNTMSSDVGLMPNITLEPLYANTNTDAVRGARGAAYNRGVKIEADRNACFSTTEQPLIANTFIGACRAAASADAEAEDVARFVRAGMTISDGLCQRHLNRLAVRENGLGGLSETLTQGGAATTTIMTVTGAAERSLGVVGSLVQLGSGLTGTARNRLTLSASTEAVYALIQGKRVEAARDVTNAMPTDFWTAYRTLDRYHNTCSYPAIRQAINAAVTNTGLNAATGASAVTGAPAPKDYAGLLRVAGLKLEDTDGSLDRVAALYAIAQQPTTQSAKLLPILNGMAGMATEVAVAADGTKRPVMDWFKSDTSKRSSFAASVAASPHLALIQTRTNALLAP